MDLLEILYLLVSYPVHLSRKDYRFTSKNLLVIIGQSWTKDLLEIKGGEGFHGSLVLKRLLDELRTDGLEIRGQRLEIASLEILS